MKEKRHGARDTRRGEEASRKRELQREIGRESEAEGRRIGGSLAVG